MLEWASLCSSFANFLYNKVYIQWYHNGRDGSIIYNTEISKFYEGGLFHSQLVLNIYRLILPVENKA